MDMETTLYMYSAFIQIGIGYGAIFPVTIQYPGFSLKIS